MRCARCKYEWHATLPKTIDVFTPPPEASVISQPDPLPEPQVQPEQPQTSSPPSSPPSPPLSSPPPPASHAPSFPDIPGFIGSVSANLPALVKESRFTKQQKMATAAFATAVFLLMFLFAALWEPASGVESPPEWEGLAFDGVKSEIRYDSGTMRLFVDGKIRNVTHGQIEMPDIKARALGADRRVIQSWVVEAPAKRLGPDASVSFHTDVPTPMEYTIQDVNLEFVARREKTHAD